MPLDPYSSEELAVQYVLGELRPDDAAAFERRLGDDAALAAEVARLRRVLVLLPLATAAEPPPGLRERILAAAEERVRQRPAVPVSRAPRRVVWSRFAAGLAAVLALAFGFDAYRVRRELVLQEELAQTLLEPDVVHRFALAGEGGFGKVALDMDGRRGALVLRDVPPLAAGQVYRLWAAVDGRDVWCADFRARPDGAVQAQFAVPVEQYTAPIRRLFVTVEPAGPPTVPTGRRVMESV